MMKKFNLGAIICSCIILACSCGVGMTQVYALSSQGQIIVSQFASAGTQWGFDLSSLISTSANTTATQQTSSGDANEQLGDLFENLNISLDISFVTDMINQLQSGKSFAEWIYDEYGDTVEIPEAVKEMSTTEIIMYLLGAAINPVESTTSINSDYIFTTTETQKADNSTFDYNKETETVSSTSIIINPSNATAVMRKTGDVDNDGKVTAADARLALRVSARLETLDAQSFDAADVNGNGVVNAKDSRSILRYAAKLTNSF